MERELKDSQNLPTILPKLGLGRHFIVHTQTETFFFFLIDKQRYIKGPKSHKVYRGTQTETLLSNVALRDQKVK